jgi:hypothetical protein
MDASYAEYHFQSCGAMDSEWSQLLIPWDSDNRNGEHETILKFTLEHNI